MNCVLIYDRFYIERNEDSTEKVHWTSLTIHDMKKIYQNLQLNTVLDPKTDVRKVYLHQLSVKQLRSECQNLGKDTTGTKVSIMI